MSISIKIETKNAAKHLASVNRAIRVGLERGSKELALKGKAYAQRNAPSFSGAVASHIVIEKQKTNEGDIHKIIAKNPKSPRWFGPGRYPDFNIVKWMHETGGVFKTDNPLGKAGTRHIKKKDPRFMYSMRDYLENIKIKVVGGKLKNIR